MRKIKELLLESKELEVFEVERLLAGFLKDKGIKAQVEKFDDYFNVYISSYAEDEGPKRIPVKKLLDYFKSLGVSEDASISKTKFGYTIVMINDDNSEKLMEAVEVDDEAGKCCICENIYHGLGNDPWPIYNSPEERCCNECKQEYVMPERNKLLRERVQKESEREDVSHAASNVVLDDKYIWLFNVLDVNGEDIEEGIEYLQDAIDVLVENQGTFLVAFPYVDPKPEDESVDIVFADNPGPIVIYNREQSTVAKGKLDRPSQERKPKEESTIKESLDSLVLEGLNNGDVLVVIEDNSNRRDIEEALSIAKEIVGPSYEWMRVQDYNIKYITMGIRESSAMVNGVINLLNKEFKNRGLDVEAYSYWITRERKSKNESIKKVNESYDEQLSAEDIYTYLFKNRVMRDNSIEALLSDPEASAWEYAFQKLTSQYGRDYSDSDFEDLYYDALKVLRKSKNSQNESKAVLDEAQAPTKKQKAVQGINDVFDYLKANKGQLDNYEKLAKYCRILLKSINSITPQTESVQTESRYGDDYYLSIDFTRTFYADMTDASRDMGEQVIEYLQEQVVYLEEAYRIYLDFEYAGTTVEEYFSTPLTYEDAKLAQQALQGEYMDVTIKRYGDE